MTLDVRIHPSQFLVNRPYGVRVQGRIYVSPAVWDLISSATDREMDLVLRSLRVLDLDDPKWRAKWKKEYGAEIDSFLVGETLADV